MKKYDINRLSLIAKGGEADVYDIGDGKVLRVLRNQNGRSFGTEKELFPLLGKHHISVPTVYEYIETDDMIAITMQKISGISMLDQLRHHPFQIIHGIEKFAGMHAHLLNIHSGGKLYSIHDIVSRLTLQASFLDQKLIDFVWKLLKELPVSDCLCHGDFHPGNILIQDNTCYIIDWGAAYCGNYVSDIAHTYLLMTNVPMIPGQNRMQHAIISGIGHFMSKTYLKQILKLKEFSLSDFSKWTVIMALKRVCYGMPSEKSARIKYISNCYELSLKGTDAATWYKYL